MTTIIECPASALTVTGTAVRGRLAVTDPAITRVTLLIDAAPYATAPLMAADDALEFDLPLPQGVLGATLDVTAGGRSILARPFDLASARLLRWGGWSAQDGAVAGRFSLDGPAAPAPGAAILVELLHEGRAVCRAAARPDDAGEYRFTAMLPDGPPEFGAGWRLSPRVGGLVLPFVLPVEAPAPAPVPDPGAGTGDPQRRVIERFLGRAAAMPAATAARIARSMTHRTRGTRLSIIMPVFNTPRAWLTEALTSVTRQWSANWELICVDDGSTAAHVRPVLDGFAFRDPRIRILRAPRNQGVAAATNHGLRAARGQYVTFLDHDDALEPDAVYALALAAQQTGAGLIYSDEALSGESLSDILAIRARPGFSHDYYLSHPYFAHMVCVRTGLARQLGGLDESLAIAAEVDFVLRAIEGAGAVAHVPRVLYRWRTHERTAGDARQAEVTAARLGALSRHLARLGSPAGVVPGPGSHEHRVDWPDPGGEVLAVVQAGADPARLAACLDALQRTASAGGLRIAVTAPPAASLPPGMARLLTQLRKRHDVVRVEPEATPAQCFNQAVRAAGRSGAGRSEDGQAAMLLFLDAGVQPIEPGWMARLRSLAARPEVGAAAPLLATGIGLDAIVAQAGLAGCEAGAAAMLRGEPVFFADGRRNPGPECSLTALRACPALDWSCLMVRREVFERLGGFDEVFAGGLAAMEFCWRVRAAGLRVLCDGHTVMPLEGAGETAATPGDLARLGTLWPGAAGQPDRDASPLLDAAALALRTGDGCKGRLAARV